MFTEYDSPTSSNPTSSLVNFKHCCITTSSLVNFKYGGSPTSSLVNFKHLGSTSEF